MLKHMYFAYELGVPASQDNYEEEACLTSKLDVSLLPHNYL